MKGHVLFDDVSEEHHFRLKDGSILKNVKDLKKKLHSMEDHVFDHHVNENRNDFHNWVRDVHKDEKLAQSLVDVNQKKEVIQAISSRFKEIIAPNQAVTKSASEAVSPPSQEQYVKEIFADLEEIKKEEKPKEPHVTQLEPLKKEEVKEEPAPDDEENSAETQEESKEPLKKSKPKKRKTKKTLEDAQEKPPKRKRTRKKKSVLITPVKRQKVITTQPIETDEDPVITIKPLPKPEQQTLWHRVREAIHEFIFVEDEH